MASTTIPAQTSGSDIINAHLISIANTAVLGGDVWSYAIASSPWANILPRGQFQTGKGARQRAMRFDRALAGSNGKFTWAAHTGLGNSSASTGNSPPDVAVGTRSLPPVTVVQARSKVDEWGLEWAACESPLFDIRDAVFNYNFVEQFGVYYEKVKEGAARAWEYKLREVYFRLCDKKILLGVPESSTPTNPYADLTVIGQIEDFADLTGYSTVQLHATGATVSNGYSTNHSVLTNGVLQDWQPKLQRLGALKNSKAGGLIPLVCSPEQMYYLKHEPGIRSDLRYGNAGTLLKGMGDMYTESWMGYNLIPDPEVPRFILEGTSPNLYFTEYTAWTYQAGNLSTTISGAATHNGGTATILTVASSTGLVANNAVRIAPTSASDDEYSGEFTVLSVPSSTTVVINKEWTDDMTGNLYLLGNGESGWVENPSYHTAPYEMSFIVFPEVMEVQTLDYPGTLGSGSSFETQPRPLGSFKWVNEYDRDFNPDKTLGFYRGMFELAPKPKKVEYGVAIMHRRAPAVTLASPSYAINSGLGLLS